MLTRAICQGGLLLGSKWILLYVSSVAPVWTMQGDKEDGVQCVAWWFPDVWLPPSRNVCNFRATILCLIKVYPCTTPRR